jgi:pseudouridine synthase
VLARAGLGSRRSVEDLIRAGRVRIGERVAELGNRVDPAHDAISVDGVPVPAHPDLRYLALHKPRGVTTTMRDPHAARTVGALIPPGPRVVPVGRLDRDSEGLLLLTNDGSLAHRLQHPSFGVHKEYLAEVRGAITRRAVTALTRGVSLDDGLSRAVSVGRVERRAGRSSLSLVMSEGRKREVRRMLDALGFPVARLVRVRVGPVRLGSLAPGSLRALTAEEVAGLYRVSGLRAARPGSRRGGEDVPACTRGRVSPPGGARPRST